MLQFGIDLGGTKTEIIVLNESGETLLRHRNATPAHSLRRHYCQHHRAGAQRRQ